MLVSNTRLVADRKLIIEIGLSESNIIDSNWICRRLTHFVTLLGPSSWKWDDSSTRWYVSWSNTSWKRSLTGRASGNSLSWRRLFCHSDLPTIRRLYRNPALYGAGYLACASNAPLLSTLIPNASFTFCLKISTRMSAILSGGFFVCSDDVSCSNLATFSEVVLHFQIRSDSAVIHFRRYMALQYLSALLTNRRHRISHFTWWCAVHVYQTSRSGL